MHVSYWLFFAALAVVAYFYRKDLKSMVQGKKAGSEADGTANTGSSSAGGGSSSGTTGSTGFVLTYSQIRALQTALNNAGKTVAVDGIIGNQTKDALISLSANPNIRSMADYQGIMSYLQNLAN
ncbi:MAG: putative peptidoglycan-binding domain-containing protein [Bacteroidota bacterium]